MLFVALALIVSLIVSAGVLVYVAFPHRGETVPGAPWIGEAMVKAADAAPTIDEDERDLLRMG